MNVTFIDRYRYLYNNAAEGSPTSRPKDRADISILKILLFLNFGNSPFAKRPIRMSFFSTVSRMQGLYQVYIAGHQGLSL